MVVESKSARNVTIEVAYAASTSEQVVVSLDIAVGSTVGHAIRVSGVLGRFPCIDLNRDSVGIFGRPVDLEDAVCVGDRVEIYRPLVVDPKQARKSRSGQAKKAKAKRR